MKIHKYAAILAFFALLATTAYSSTAYSLDFSQTDRVAIDLVEGDSLTYVHGEQVNILYLMDVSENSIVLDINDEPAVIAVEKDVVVDLETDGVFDLRITLVSTEGDTATLVFTQSYITDPYTDTAVGIVTVNVEERQTSPTGLVALSHVGTSSFMLIMVGLLGFMVLLKYRFSKSF